jgi:RNA polymerase sigma-70 factor (ECF subfamily)
VNENDIIIEVQKGKTENFSMLVDMYKNKVFALAYKFTNDYNEAQDLSQEIFIKVFKHIHGFRFECSFSTWIYKIATNKCIDYRRKNKIGALSFNEEYNNKIALDNESKSVDKSPEEIIITDEGHREVHKIIHDLPDIYKTVVVMYHINESSYKEIAQTLDIPEKTVETRLYRARRLLKEKLIKANMGGEIGWNVKKS